MMYSQIIVFTGLLSGIGAIFAFGYFVPDKWQMRMIGALLVGVFLFVLWILAGTIVSEYSRAPSAPGTVAVR